MEKYRIVLADDHVMIRRGLRKILEGRENFEVVGEAGDGGELLALLDSVVCDMVVLDLSMPHLGGIDAARQIKSRNAGIKVLVLTMHKDLQYVHHAISSGVDGYLLKEDADRELFSAIGSIRRGSVYLSPRLSDGVAEDWSLIRMGAEAAAEPLTARETEVLKLIATGKSNKEIADILLISIRTVEAHRGNIMDKLRMKNSAELVKYALQNGYI